MSIYLDRIKQLVALQAVDDDLFTVDKELEQAPKLVEKLGEEFAAVDAQRTRLNDKMTHLTEQNKRVDLEIEDDSSRLRKSKNKLMQVANSKEYQAMAREMDSMEKVSRSREEERSAIAEEVRLQSVSLEQVNAQWEELKVRLEAEQGSLDTRLAKARARRNQLEASRKTCCSDVPRPILDRYEFIQRRLAHPVIVPVTLGVCDGCHITIPPQAYIELQSGHRILNCPNCQRLIYWSEHFSVGGKAASSHNDD